MDEAWILYHVTSLDDSRYVTKKKIFLHYPKLKEIGQLRNWEHVHLDGRSMTLRGITFGFSNKICEQTKVPELYFGQKQEKNDFQEPVLQKDTWTTQSTQMIAMCSGMITLGFNASNEACFVISPTPGSKQLDHIPFKQYPDIEDMVFTDNSHILIRFKNNKIVKF